LTDTEKRIAELKSSNGELRGASDQIQEPHLRREARGILFSKQSRQLFVFEAE